MVGQNWKFYQSCRHLTLEHDTFYFVSGWDILLFIIDFPGLGCSFFPSTWSLPRHHDHQSHGSESFQTPELCHQYVQALVPLQLHLLLILCTIWNHFYPFALCRWCGIHHGPPSTRSLPVDFSSLSGKFAERLPFSTLELTCPNGKFFTLDDKFSSLSFVRVTSRVFNFSSLFTLRELCCWYLESHCYYWWFLLCLLTVHIIDS